MFRHVAMWRFDEDDAPGLRRENAIKIKAGLEELAYEVHGITEIDVWIDPLRATGSNADIFLECVFEDREAYEDFLEHPRLKAAMKLIEACTEERLSMDFEVDAGEAEY